uniref:Uncharacterized protein n=2 Tax=Oryza TaxID=4527 RepID=A0A0D3HCB7_9ORYZ
MAARANAAGAEDSGELKGKGGGAVWRKRNGGEALPLPEWEGNESLAQVARLGWVLQGCRPGGVQQGNQAQWEHFQHEVETARTMRGELVDALKLTLQLLFLGFREEGGMWA